MLVIGVDPGVTGAVASITHSGLDLVLDIPTMSKPGGKGFIKRQINASALAENLRHMTRDWDKNNIMVWIELVNAMAGQGRSSIASIGQSCGIIEGVVAAIGLPYTYVTPQVWKKAYPGIGRDKEQARALAQRYYPQADLARVKDHNRAEAILISRYGYDQSA